MKTLKEIQNAISRADIDTKELRELAEFCNNLAEDLEADARADEMATLAGRR